MWADEEDEEFDLQEEEEAYSSEEELGTEGWVGVDWERVADGMRRRKAGRGEVPYEDRWEVDREELAKRRVCLASCH